MDWEILVFGHVIGPSVFDGDGESMGIGVWVSEYGLGSPSVK